MTEVMTYTRKQLELVKGRAALAEIAIGVGAKTSAKMTNPKLIEAILSAQERRDGGASSGVASAGAGADEVKKSKPKRKRATRAVKHDADGVVMGDDGNPEPLPEEYSNEPPPPLRFNSEEEAIAEIARTSVVKERAVESLSSVRRELNNEVKQARASLAGSVESGVDYSDHMAVRAKLETVTSTWQHLQECEEKRREELIPYREAVQAARKAYKEALDGGKQLRLFS